MSSSCLIRCCCLGLLLILGQATGDNGSCSAEDGTCTESSSTREASSFCGDPLLSLYDNGGSAQAYRPDAPLTNVVCRSELAKELRYKAASWPYTRRSMRKGSAPTLDVTLTITSCEESGERCTCSQLPSSTARNASSVVEIWQTRPDGQYSPLRQRVAHSNDCRAQVPFTDKGTAQFSTVAPGSTGIMGGLGPGGWEWNPYGPPAIHFLVKAAGHASLLVDLPVLVHPKTLEPRQFSIGDFRGTAWVRSQPADVPMRIRSWVPNTAENRITVEVDIFMQRSLLDEPEFCPSYIYGFPSSFFLEPMSVCAPFLLDFFAL